MRSINLGFTLIFAAICLLLSSNVRAATLNAATCSQADVQRQLEAAAAGDTIQIPAGSCSWTSTLTVTKSITIQGAGCSLSTIGNRTGLPTSCSTTLTPGSSGLFYINNTGGFVRISSMTFSGGSADGVIQVGGNNSYIRIDHINVINPAGRTVYVGKDFSYMQVTSTWPIKMLIDHIYYNSGTEFLLVWGRSQDWLEPDAYGTDNFIFIEDSYFNTPSSCCGCITDYDFGAGRMTARYNTLINSAFCKHDAQNRLRGFRLTEEYNNEITCVGADCNNFPSLELRGGTGLFYNNTIAGNFFGWFNEIFRVAYSTDGFDGWHIGTQANCGSGIKACYYSGVGLWGHYSSNGAACPDGYTANCLLTCTSDSQCGSGKCVYVDGSGGGNGNYPCRDQNGWGQDDANGQNTISPFYVWGNYQNGVLLNANGSAYPQQVQEGRDFCNHSPATACGSKAAWTYTPYTYPHPLQGGRLEAPKNLRILQ